MYTAWLHVQAFDSLELRLGWHVSVRSDLVLALFIKRLGF